MSTDKFRNSHQTFHDYGLITDLQDLSRHVKTSLAGPRQVHRLYLSKAGFKQGGSNEI